MKRKVLKMICLCGLFLAGISSVFGEEKKSANTLANKIRSNSKTACEGKWLFTNGETTTIILCNSDGSMNVRMDKGNDIKLWKGSYTSTKNEIKFHSILYKERINGVDRTDSKTEENWEISYKVTNTVEMRVTSDTMPPDLNGYTFSNSAIFHVMK